LIGRAVKGESKNLLEHGPKARAKIYCNGLRSNKVHMRTTAVLFSFSRTFNYRALI